MPSSLLANDLLLIIVVISSMTVAIIYPDFGSLFQGLPIYCVMANFFLSYLSIELTSVWQALKVHGRQIIMFTIMKLIILPVILFFVFGYLAPAYALSALLLTGVSTGVVAPFISNLVRGNSSLVLVVVVITSVLAPFTLPALIKIVAVSQVEISFFGMIRMLALVIFVPILAVEVLRRIAPGLLAPLIKRQFPVSLVLFAIINLGVFYRYAPFFKKEPSVIILATVVTLGLAAVYCAVGIFFFRKNSLENQLAGAVILGNLNNVLVIVFSSEFFGPVEPLVAAMYIIPFFGLVIPLRYYYHRKNKTA
ncbi:MAG: bile acid:sodium symporter [Smithellaceae bacterium]